MAAETASSARSKTTTPASRVALVHEDGKEQTPRGTNALIGCSVGALPRKSLEIRDSLPPAKVRGGLDARKKKAGSLPRGGGLLVTEEGAAC